jgi:hypothetical protein
MLSLVNTINDMIDQLAIFAAEVKKVAREVGTEGKLGVQAEVGNVQGIWQEITWVSISSKDSVSIHVHWQFICQHHGVELDDSSPRLCPNLGSSNGRRFHKIYHC